MIGPNRLHMKLDKIVSLHAIYYITYTAAIHLTFTLSFF